jgi:hypothetical protein
MRGFFYFVGNVCSASILSHVDVLIHFQMPCIDSDARQRYFTVRATKSARQRSFTGQKSVVRSLPAFSRKHTVKAFRAFWFLCLAPAVHCKFGVCRSE